MAKKKVRKFNNQGYIVLKNLVRGSYAPSDDIEDQEGQSRIDNSKLANSINIYKIVGDYKPSNFVSKLYKSKNTKAFRELLDLETYKLSSLVPDISLYKVQKGKYIPFYFPVSSENVTRESILGPGTGFFASGIKNISVSYTGNNPFSFDKQVDCSITFYVDNLENIFKKPPAGYATFADLFTISRANSKTLSSGFSKEVSTSQVLTANGSEIALKMGYKLPESSRIFTSAEKTAIKETSTTLRMNYTGHTINVNQDGSATIDVSYNGRIERALTDSLYDLMKDPLELVVLAGFKTGDKQDKKPDNLSDEEKEEAEAVRKGRQASRLRHIFQYLTNDRNVSGKNQRIHDYSLSNTDIEEYREFQTPGSVTSKLQSELNEDLKSSANLSAAQQDINAEQIKITNEQQSRAISSTKRLDTGQGSIDLGGVSLTQDNSAMNNPKLIDANLALDADPNKIDYASMSTAAVDGLSELNQMASEMNRSSIESTNARIADLKRDLMPNKQVSYVYVGDVVESICFNLANTINIAIRQATRLKSSKDMTKQIEVLQESLQSLRTIKILFSTVPVNVGNGKKKFINIADIPLDLSLIGRHLFEEIEQLSKHKFSVKRFLDDLCCRLISSALSAEISEDNPALASNIEIRSLLVTGPKSRKMTNKVVEIDVDDLPDFHSNTRSKKSETDHDYYVVYSELVEKDSSGLQGSYRDDMRNGIYHLQIGKNRGLLKNVSFSQFDVPGRREALMIESVSLYDELKMPYTAQISMFGNNFFLPGMLIYLNPSSIGFGDPRSKNSAAFRLGLGGYYQILSVNTSFDGSIFNTDLSTSYVSWADSDSAFLSEIKPSTSKAPDQSPESNEMAIEAFEEAPEFKQEKTSDYHTLKSTTLLTEKEKSDIIKAELGSRPVGNENITTKTTPAGERQYTVRRGRNPNIVITIGKDNQTSISSERGR